MGGVMAEKLRLEGLDVSYVTPMSDASHWTHNTMEQAKIQTRLIELGIKIVPLHNLASIEPDHIELACVFTDRKHTLPCKSVVMVTMREAEDALYHTLTANPEKGPKTVTRIGDCLAPGTIAAAVYSGHRYAREMGEPVPEGVPFRRELIALAAD
jgi:dimethylamine/trimethylamine dehydrogenase